jgi:hypothetical protein
MKHSTILQSSRNYALGSPDKKLAPWFVSGFTDGEGSFIATIYKNKEYRSGWQVQAIFSISLHTKDLPLLKGIQSFFGVGTIKVNKSKNTVIYCVAGQKELIEVIIPHFDKYPLLTQKRAPGRQSGSRRAGGLQNGGLYSIQIHC